ncbi:hypothetical protein CONPUDRAFT_101998 [Coniophora puteana RWD-64-598 SS2]|uniref:U3 small nucleolar RNA-associated protein 6 N-terminal domain-containing protein n=1 Tax=Coniophora puteana (strain RWD-64-598) TaxID=741705 RepID=A0A5M3MVZ1_CONPW|nr:uncharacterized protein CONPUDRAFT_101998 [Coniophora puteana RWD-64-598 SS2]EIW83286.1 hypothetical protein CONPUDRAFT_101998 [Coniophora puteana RWD-64-598 SS2]
MERVQFEQEQMLSELKDLVEKNIFTQAEVKQILKKRTHFETLLVRRIPRRSDFLRYAAYEMSLEQLRRKRVERLKIPKSLHSISDYALVRRQFQIFERALKRFKGDVGLWIQYIEVAKREGARALVGRITARALQLHPTTPSLYIMAASHELTHLSPSAARTLLQRGLRLNADSVDMWREYVRMELGFIETLRRRWQVLGISVSGSSKSLDDEPVAVAEDITSAVGMDGGGGAMVVDEEGEMEPTEKAAEQKDGEGEAARKAIMDGAIVKSAMSSAASALPKVELFESLDTLIRGYPVSLALRTSLLDYLHDLLREALPNDASAIKMHATRRLNDLVSLEAKDILDSEDFVDALRGANDEMTSALHNTASSSLALAREYTVFVLEWHDKLATNESLRSYLVATLQSAARRSAHPSPLRTAHLQLLRAAGPSASEEYKAKVLKQARKYTAVGGASDPTLWLERLNTERAFAPSADEVDKAWAEARRCVRSADPREVENVWVWGFLFWLDPEGEEIKKTFENLLRESMRDASLQHVHETLLLRYIPTVLYRRPGAGGPADPAQRKRALTRVASAYLPSSIVWAAAFGCEARRDASSTEPGAGASTDVLSAVYGWWRGKEPVTATLAWASWLLEARQGHEASKVVERAGADLDEGARQELRRKWKERLDKAGTEREAMDEHEDEDL